ncbi:MAG TPA: 2-phospho-L-lactate guanylyltransferase [Solirubrobacteraceae bacterium]
MRTAAILPVKRFAEAKQRLGSSGVDDSLRADLARAMVGDVLVALRDIPSLDRTIVVTNERSVVAAARYQGALVVPDTSETGQNGAIALGVERALAEGFGRVLCVPGDCPALDPMEIDALLAQTPIATREHPLVVIVPDRHGAGTNGLLLTPPDAIASSFGPDSCERHLDLARAVSASCRIERPASLLLDVDTDADLAVLRGRLADAHDRAPRTRAVLGLPPAQANPVAKIV